MNYTMKLKPQKQESRDEFEDFLEDEGVGVEKPKANFKYTVTAPESIQQIPKGAKCFPVFLGGSDLLDGYTSGSMYPKSCC